MRLDFKPGRVLAMICAGVLFGQAAHAHAAVRIGEPARAGDLTAQLQQAYAKGARNITIRPGTYLLPYGNKHVFLLKNWKDAAIHARGVTLISSEFEWNRNFFAIEDCSGVTVEGPTLSQTTLSSYQGRVTGVSSFEGKHYVTWKPDAGYPVPKAGDSKIDCFFADPATRRLKSGLGDFWGRAQTSLGDGTFRVELDGRAAKIQPRDALVGRYGNMPFKVSLLNSRDCTIKDVTMSRNGFAAIREDGFHGGGNHIIGCKWTPGPKPEGAAEEPLVSGAADGLHSTGANPGPHIEKCAFEGIILDDPIAIHGSFQEVTESQGETIKVKNGYAGLKISGPIRIYDQKGYLREGTVIGLRENGDGTSTVTLDSDLKVPVGAKLTNPLTCGPGYRILNNKIQGTRSRGILVKGDGGLIKGNVIEDCGMAAISIGPEYYWNEADYVRGARIEGNVLRRNGSVDNPVVYIHGEGTMGNRDIEIVNNTMEDNYRPGVGAYWAQFLRMEGNTFIQKTLWPPRDQAASPMVLENCKDVTIKGNQVITPGKLGAPVVAIKQNVTGVQSDIPAP